MTNGRQKNCQQFCSGIQSTLKEMLDEKESERVRLQAEVEQLQAEVDQLQKDAENDEVSNLEAKEPDRWILDQVGSWVSYKIMTIIRV